MTLLFLIFAQLLDAEPIDQVFARTVFSVANQEDRTLFSTISTGVPPQYETWLWQGEEDRLQKLDPNLVWPGAVAYVCGLGDGGFGIMTAVGPRYYVLTADLQLKSRALELDEGRTIEALYSVPVEGIAGLEASAKPSGLATLKFDDASGAHRELALFNFETGTFRTLIKEAKGVERWVWFAHEGQLYRGERLSGSIAKVWLDREETEVVVKPQRLLEDPDQLETVKLLARFGKHLSAHRLRLDVPVVVQDRVQFFAPDHVDGSGELIKMKDVLYPVMVFRQSQTEIRERLLLGRHGAKRFLFDRQEQAFYFE